MASSPASPPPSCIKPGTGLGLAFTTHCPIPQGSVLRSNARRVVQHSGIKEVLAAQQQSLVAGALGHIGLMEQVGCLQSENTELKSKIRELAEQLNAAQERADAAESEAAKALAAAQQALPADTAAAAGETLLLNLNQASKADLVQRVQDLEQELLHTQQERREAHNQLVELKGAVRVLCRVRPSPQSACTAPAVHALPDTTSVSVNCYGQDTTFAFSRVFAPSSTQTQLFAEVAEVVQSALDGYHVCLMSYGQTGSGKTHSMLGPPGSQSQEHQGIIPRAIDKLLRQVERLRHQGWSYSLQVSCMELYNNGIRDLLPASSSSMAAGSRTAADNVGAISDMNAIKHDETEGTIVVGVSRHPINTVQQALALLQQAGDSRQVHGTNCNSTSSRSHCVFWMHVRAKHVKDSVQISGALCLVDLAGSERLERSGAVGDRKTETAAINTSLSALGDVFTALSNKAAHVPFRNSKLTYLLKPCLSQGGKTLFLVHINPEQAAAHESLTSLRFATKVAGTELGQARKNISSSQAPLSLMTQPTHTLVAASSGVTAPAFCMGSAGAVQAQRRAAAGGSGKATRNGATVPVPAMKALPVPGPPVAVADKSGTSMLQPAPACGVHMYTEHPVASEIGNHSMRLPIEMHAAPDAGRHYGLTVCPIEASHQYHHSQAAIPPGQQQTEQVAQQPTAVTLPGGHTASDDRQGPECGRLEMLFNSELEEVGGAAQMPATDVHHAAAAVADAAFSRQPAAGRTGGSKVAGDAGAGRESVDLRAALRRKRQAADIAGRQGNDDNEAGAMQGAKRATGPGRQQARGAWH